jgi:haloalkane dehalogenase
MNHRTDWRSEYPFASRWLSLGGTRYHYLDEGAGRTILLVHGNPTWSFLWRHVVRDLRGEYRLVAPDHVGCGLSDKPRNATYSLPVHAAHLVQLIDRLKLQKFTLAVHDWGGPIGLRAALSRPGSLERLVVFNTGAFPPPFIPWRIRACRIPVLGRLAVQGLNLFARAAQQMAVADPCSLSTVARAGLLAPYDSWSHRRAIFQFVRDIPSTDRHPTWRHLEELERQLPGLRDVPIQIIWGMRDWCFRPLCLDRLRAAWPHAEVHRLPDAGHWVTEEATDRTNSLIRDFLAQTDK